MESITRKTSHETRARKGQRKKTGAEKKGGGVAMEEEERVTLIDIPKD